MCVHCDNLIKAIDRYITKTDDELEDELESEGRALPRASVKMESELEEGIAVALLVQTDYFVKKIKRQASVAELMNILQDIKDKDACNEAIKEVASKKLKEYIPPMVVDYAKGMDKGIVIDKVSKGTTAWINNWSEELGNIMQLNSHKEIETILNKALENGDSIQTATRAILDSGIRDEYYKARRVAMTELFRAHNVSRQEAAMQSPVVTGKMWRHTGVGEPRINHYIMDGTIVPKDEPFELEGADGYVYHPMYPIDPCLPAGEAINCHCIAEEVIDQSILGLSTEELQQLRDEALAKLDDEWERSVDEEYRNLANLPTGEKSVDISPKSGTIKSIDVDDFNIMAKGRDIKQNVSDTIINTIKDYEHKGGMYISNVHFGNFYDSVTGNRALFQVFPNAYGLTEMNINSEILAGRTVEEIDRIVKDTPINVANSLKEAVIHECGHAKAYYQKSVREIAEMNKILENKGITGISYIASKDGAECIAEVEVLLYRGEKVPQEAIKLYNEWIGGKKR